MSVGKPYHQMKEKDNEVNNFSCFYTEKISHCSFIQAVPRNTATLVQRGLISDEILLLHIFTIKSLKMNFFIEERKAEAR